MTALLVIFVGILCCWFLARFSTQKFGKGASLPGNANTVQLNQDDSYYMSLGATDKRVGDYAKRSIKLFLFFLGLVVLFAVMFLSIVHW